MMAPLAEVGVANERRARARARGSPPSRRVASQGNLAAVHMVATRGDCGASRTSGCVGLVGRLHEVAVEDLAVGVGEQATLCGPWR